MANLPMRVPLPTFRPDQGGMGAFPPAPAAPMQQAPMQAAPAQRGGIRNWLGNNSEALAAMSQGLLSGRTGQEQFANGFGGFIGARADSKKRTKTMAFLEQQDPMTAQAVELGLLTGPEAFKAIYDAKNKPTEYQQRAQAAQQYGIDPNTPEGRAFVLTGTLKSAEGVKPESTVGKINADFNAGLIDQATRDALVAKAAASEGMEITSDGQGGFTMRQGLGVGGKKMTESQAKANIYASRGENANQLLSELESQGTSLGQAIVSGVPVAGNYALTPEYQKYEQAKRDFVNAILRQESGAVIADQEFRNAEKQYFPQPGDGPEVIAQKKRNREVALKAIREASGQPAPEGQPAGGVQSYRDYFGGN